MKRDLSRLLFDSQHPLNEVSVRDLSSPEGPNQPVPYIHWIFEGARRLAILIGELSTGDTESSGTTGSTGSTESTGPVEEVCCPGCNKPPGSSG